MLSRTLWRAGAIGGAVTLLLGGLSMVLLPEYKTGAGFGLIALGSLVFAYVFKHIAASRRDAKVAAIERCFRELPGGISALRRDAEDRRWHIIHSDRLVRIRCEMACESAATMVRDVQRFNSAFPNDVLSQMDGVSTWIAILVYLKLRSSSPGERMNPDLPSADPTFDDVAAASLVACDKLRQKERL